MRRVNGNPHYRPYRRDRIELFYEDSPEATIRATVNRLLSDRDEGMGLV